MLASSFVYMFMLISLMGFSCQPIVMFSILFPPHRHVCRSLGSLFWSSSILALSFPICLDILSTIASTSFRNGHSHSKLICWILFILPDNPGAAIEMPDRAAAIDGAPMPKFSRFSPK